jgi:excisionase family DNA binding protein
VSTTALPKLLFTVEEAAECLGIKRTKMYALIKAGEIDTVQVGRLRRVRLAELESYTARLIDAARAA